MSVKADCRQCRHVAYKPVVHPVVKVVVLACKVKRVRFVDDGAGLVAAKSQHSRFDWAVKPKECKDYETATTKDGKDC
jgi:hypothetical protein